MNDWKHDNPANDVTVYIPKIREPRPPIEPLLRLPAWAGRAVEFAVWTVVSAMATALLFFILRIVLLG